MVKVGHGFERVTLKDVANASGFSVNTVSAVLNDRRKTERVGEKTAQHILKIAKELGYRRNLAAYQLVGGRTKSLGVLVDLLTNPFAAPIAEAFERETSSAGYQCLLGCTEYNGLKKVEYIHRFLEFQVEGLLLVTVWLNPDVEEALKEVLSTRTRLIAVDFPWRDYDVPTVCCDHRQGGRLLGQHLHELGHTKILYLATERDLGFYSVQERIAGIQEALEAEADGKCVLEIGETQGYDTHQLGEVAIRYMKGESPPTALAFSHDINAFVAMKHLESKGYRVPNDVAMVGFDDAQYELFHPFRVEGVQPTEVPITTVRQPLREIGAEAARQMMRAIEKPDEASSGITALEVELVVRASSTLPEWARNGR
ncbi:MAG: LacI family DNA-binding transcriptional regulator [Candidatus Omnitrophica bacterium]|nr:LacI family DNA-binding transcriptional regulator [Candidatus Omnitrophota bacterium]MCA9447366.1 LacI family DNA-binding transcriptional regulator [Candidatus Omnitrophota bacterium]MCB9766781.1 LacI family DNA-binding transcriptional regulator [Candidatus Omnitrophota bacterium]